MDMHFLGERVIVPAASMERLKKLRKAFRFGGGFQVIGTTLAVAVLLGLGDVQMSEGIFYGFPVSLSSTAVVCWEQTCTSPPVDFHIEAGDNLVLVVAHRGMGRAFRFLEQDQGRADTETGDSDGTEGRSSSR